MFTPTQRQQELIDNNAHMVHELAKAMWEKINEIDYDPIHPLFDYFEDPIKDKFIAAASYAVASLNLHDNNRDDLQLNNPL